MRHTVLLLSLSCACAPPPVAERDRLTSARSAAEPPIVGAVSRVGDRAVWVERADDGPFTRLVATDGAQRRILAEPRGSIDRPVLSPDGERVAFVYAPDGVAAIGVVPFSGGAIVQVTNRDLARRKHPPGQPPEGFVPVPDGDSLAFSGAGLEWRAKGETLSAPIPEVQP